jgi:plasmid stabilization system protein ParE
MRWKLSLRANADLQHVVHRIAIYNPRAAEQWLRKLLARARVAGRSPGLGRKVPEIERDDIREAIVGECRLVYLVKAKVVVILTIFEGHRLLPDLDPELE